MYFDITVTILANSALNTCRAKLSESVHHCHGVTMEPWASVGSIQVASLDVFPEECRNDEAQKFVKD